MPNLSAAIMQSTQYHKRIACLNAIEGDEISQKLVAAQGEFIKDRLLENVGFDITTHQTGLKALHEFYETAVHMPKHLADAKVAEDVTSLTSLAKSMTPTRIQSRG